MQDLLLKPQLLALAAQAEALKHQLDAVILLVSGKDAVCEHQEKIKTGNFANPTAWQCPDCGQTGE